MTEQKNKNDLNQPVTRGEFQEHTETLIKVVATKEDLRELKNELTDNITIFKNEILTSNDNIVRKLDTILTEFPAINEKQRNHTDRIGTLEAATRQI